MFKIPIVIYTFQLICAIQHYFAVHVFSEECLCGLTYLVRTLQQLLNLISTQIWQKVGNLKSLVLQAWQNGNMVKGWNSNQSSWRRWVSACSATVLNPRHSIPNSTSFVTQKSVSDCKIIRMSLSGRNSLWGLLHVVTIYHTLLNLWKVCSKHTLSSKTT